MNSSNDIKRETGIEFLRCLLMLIIVSVHCIGHGPFRGVGNGSLKVLSILLCWHVDAFIAISGWFGVRFSWRKPIRLIGVMAFYSGIGALYLVFTRGGPYRLSDFVVSGGWFGTCYLTFLFLTPLLNLAIDQLKDKSAKSLFAVWIPLAVIYTYNWLPRNFLIEAHAQCGGFSVYQFVFIYVTARFVRFVHDRGSLIPLARKILIGYTLLGVGVFAAVMLSPSLFSFAARIYTYDCPVVWCVAVAIVVLCSQIRFEGLFWRLCLFAAPSMFSVYLFQDTTKFRNALYFGLEKRIAIMTDSPFLAIVGCIIATFIMALTLDFTRRLAVAGFRKVRGRIFSRDVLCAR